MFTRHDPGCFVFLLDRSDSMKRPWGQSGMSLASGAAHALNRILFDLVSRANTHEGVRNYFDVGAFGYGAREDGSGEGVQSALGGPMAGHTLVPISVLAANYLRLESVTWADPSLAHAQLPVWIQPMFGYRTPMCEAIAVAGEYVQQWAEAHPHSYPPVVINITDGWVTDSPYQGASLQEWATRLTTIGTSDGAALLFNVFLSDVPAEPQLFPSAGSDLPEPGAALFDLSSPLPAPMIERADLALSPGARGFCFNADMASLVKFLEIGTDPFRDRTG